MDLPRKIFSLFSQRRSVYNLRDSEGKLTLPKPSTNYLKCSFFEVLKTFRFATILVHYSQQSSLGLKVVMYMYRQIKEHVNFRLDLSCLLYLCKFNFVVHIKCCKGAFCMDYEAKFTEVKQPR